MRIQSKLFLNMLIVTICLAFVGGMGVFSTNSVANVSLALFENQALPVLKINELSQTAQKILMGLIAHTSANESELMEQIEQEQEQLIIQFTEQVQEYEEILNKGNADLQEEVPEDSRFQVEWEKFSQVSKKVIALSQDYTKEEALSLLLGEGKQTYDQALLIFIQKTDEHQKQMNILRDEAISTRENSMLIITFLISVALIVILGGGWWIIRNISGLLIKLVGQLSNSSQQLASASNQISNGSEQLSKGAIEQAASLEETSASMEQMASQTKENAEGAAAAAEAMGNVASMVKQSAENAKNASALSEDAKNSAESGSQSMEDIASAMKEIREGSDKITDIIEVINEITHQTKMLATNAAIEAARAGDQGKGFAVVADEVSKLAENSKTAAKEIAILIKDSSRKAQAGNELAETGQNMLQEILDKFVKVADLVDEISVSSEEQSVQVDEVEHLVANIKNASAEQANGVEQVNRALREMDAVTQSNAANSEETASSAEELSGQAQSLQDVVGTLSLHVGLQKNDSVSSKEQLTAVHPSNRDQNDRVIPIDPQFHLPEKINEPNSKKGRLVKPSEKIPMREDFKEF